ncbi:MAG: 50S ribosomal protein L4 [Thermoprotei archaeon]|nr:MAG: 50S ribosomal protein L4 [Thermoprotei archaeon]
MVWTIVHTLKLEKLKVPVYGVNGEPIGETELPDIFSLIIRKDLIRRAFHSAFTARLQPKGRDPLAGKRTTARSWGVGYGMARVPRLPNGRAAFISFARGGHRAFPPRPDKRIHEEINRKEMAYAIISALAATAKPEFVRARGHVFSAEKLPIIVDDGVEKGIIKARDAREFLKKIGVWEDIERAGRRTRIRAGRGKMRGRRYIEPRSVLFVLNNTYSEFALAVRNMPGVDVTTPNLLNILYLAPGGVPGRLTVYSVSALEAIASKYKVVTL